MDTNALAKQIRLDSLRMTSRAGTSHIGSMFSVADIIAVLYGKALQLDPQRPDWPERDRIIISKGHAGGVVYAALSACGFFPRELLDTYCQNGSILGGHISHRGVPGVELSTGSLGQGLGVAAGMAYAAKQGDRSHRVYTVLSDGECDEGSNWEAIMFAAHHQLDNLVVVVDYNKIQSLKSVAETLALEPFADKWRSFGWGVWEVDGHDHAALESSFQAVPFEKGQPSVIIAHTVKGKGVSFMENSVLWHYRCARGEEYAAAVQELEGIS